METYLLMLFVTWEQEKAIQALFSREGWAYQKKVSASEDEQGDGGYGLKAEPVSDNEPDSDADLQNLPQTDSEDGETTDCEDQGFGGLSVVFVPPSKDSSQAEEKVEVECVEKDKGGYMMLTTGFESDRGAGGSDVKNMSGSVKEDGEEEMKVESNRKLETPEEESDEEEDSDDDEDEKEDSSETEDYENQEDSSISEQSDEEEEKAESEGEQDDSTEVKSEASVEQQNCSIKTEDIEPQEQTHVEKEEQIGIVTRTRGRPRKTTTNIIPERPVRKRKEITKKGRTKYAKVEHQEVEMEKSKKQKQIKPVEERKGTASDTQLEKVKHSKCHVCENCGKAFTSKYSLFAHQQNKAFCLRMRKKRLISDTASKLTSETMKDDKGMKTKHDKMLRSASKKEKEGEEIQSGVKDDVENVTKNKHAKQYTEKTHEKPKPSRKVEEKNFQCSECGRSFARERYIESHKRDGKCIFKCEYCGKVFISAQYAKYKNHIASHTGEKNAFCDICGNNFRNEQTLMAHRETHDKVCKYICQICSRGYKQKSQLNAHMRVIHRGKKRTRVQCEVCGATFTDNRTLREHNMAAHLDQQPYACEVCGKRFSYKNSLCSHRLVHRFDDAVYKYMCEYCPKRFKTGTYLQRHRWRHTKSYKHFCDECGRGFYDTKKLKEHIRTHTGEKPYKCDHCDYKCTTKGNLGIHLKGVHGKTDPTVVPRKVCVTPVVPVITSDSFTVPQPRMRPPEIPPFPGQEFWNTY